MLIKTINVGDWEWNEPVTRMVTYGRQSLVKQASTEDTWYKKYEPHPDYIYLLTLALGAGEAYGANRNGDFFSEEDLIKCHHTFVSDAKHYKHHINKDPKNCYGEVMESYYNPRMRRVELIVRVDRKNKENKDMIDKAEQGIPVPVSMAAKVSYDVCSICGNKARKLSEYCEDLKKRMLKVLPDGRLVYAINPNPKFFDISEVVVGADPTAHAFKKVASLYVPTTYKPNVEACLKSIEVLQKGVATSKSASYNGEYTQKRAILERLAELEKKIPGYIVKPLKDTLSDKKLPSPKGEDTSEYVEGMAKNGIALRASDLYNSKEHLNRNLLISREKKASPDCMFRFLLNDPRRDEILNSMELVKKSNNKHFLDHYADDRSLLSTYCTKRANELSHVKKASNDSDNTEPEVYPYSDILKVAALNVCAIFNNPSLLDDPLFCKSLIVQNKIGV